MNSLGLSSLSSSGAPRVAPAHLALRRSGGTNDRGIHHGTALDHRPTLGRHVVDYVHHLRGLAMALQQPAKPQNRSLIGKGVVDELKPDETAHRLDPVEGICHGRIGERKPLVHEMDAQHRLKRHWRAPTPARLRILRLNERRQLLSRDDLLHLGEKLLPARAALFGCKAQRGKVVCLVGSACGSGKGAILPGWPGMFHRFARACPRLGYERMRHRARQRHL